MSSLIHSLFGEKRFQKEFKRELRTLIIFTLGFTIAFSWRQTIFDLSQSFVQFITKVSNPNTSTIITSIFTTLICIILIFLFSHLLKNNPENY
jgi:hypothetical protein